jgi:multiple sugar transport system substrate-binding protein
MTRESASGWPLSVSRRELLRYAGVAALAVSGASLLAACGASAASTTAATSTAATTATASSAATAAASSMATGSAAATTASAAPATSASSAAKAAAGGKATVQYWHMWNTPWKEVIEGQVVPMFNQSSSSVVVQPTLIVSDNKGSPEEKVITAIAGGTPPDIMTEWNKVLPTWADKGVITALEPLLVPSEQAPFKAWFWPIAYQIGQYQGHQYGAPSTMNSWALVWNKQLFQQAGLDPEQGPKDIQTLDSYAEKLFKQGSNNDYTQIGFMPGDLWQFSDVFGGDFYDDATQKITIDADKNLAALNWIVGYDKRYPAAQQANLNKINGASDAGKIWSQLTNTIGMSVDGQWRVIDAARDVAKGFTYGVVPLPYPPGGRPSASWINGNYQVIFKEAKQQRPAMDFLKFWSGFGSPDQMGTICTFGGWIPCSPQVVPTQPFQDYLKKFPAFKVWTDIYQSPNTRITPVIGIQQDFSNYVDTAQNSAKALKAEPQAALTNAQQQAVARMQQYQASQKS